MKKTKTSSGFYEVIKELYTRRDKEQALIDMQSIAYKMIIYSDLRALSLKINREEYGELYLIFKDNFNNQKLTHIDPYYEKAISYVIPCKGNSIKKKRKMQIE